MHTYTTKTGDGYPIFEATLDVDDLSTASDVRLYVQHSASGDLVVNDLMVIEDAAAGAVSYQFSGTQTSLEGYHISEIVVDWGDGTQTFPDDDYFVFEFTEPVDRNLDPADLDDEDVYVTTLFTDYIQSNTEAAVDVLDPMVFNGSDLTGVGHLGSSTLGTDRISNGDYNETVVSGGVAGVTGLDITTANVFRHTLTDNTEFTFDNPSADPPGNSFTLIVEQDATGGWAITWPTSVEWDSGTAPNLSTAAGDKHMLGFVSPDGGTTWIGLVSAENLA